MEHYQQPEPSNLERVAALARSLVRNVVDVVKCNAFLPHEPLSTVSDHDFHKNHQETAA